MGKKGYHPNETEANANTAFYATTGSEFEVVGYNEKWIAVQGEGGIDESCGIIIQCGEKDGSAFQSWKPHAVRCIGINM